MNDLLTLYYDANAIVNDEGIIYDNTRLGKVKEHIGFTLKAENDVSGLVNLPSFKHDYAKLFVETILAGKSMRDVLPSDHPAQKYIGQEHDGHLSTEYGPRLLPQLDKVVAELMTCNNSRRATFVVLRESDNWLYTNFSTEQEYPCVIAYVFNLREDKLYLSIHLRSSNVFRTLPYDLFIAHNLFNAVVTACNSYAEAYGLEHLQGVNSEIIVHFDSAHVLEKDFELQIKLLDI